MPESSRPAVAAEVRARQEAWMAAWIANDRATLERILAPEFALVVSAQPEARVDRAAWLRTAGTEYTCESFRYDGMQVRDFGEVVVVSSLATQRATAFGRDRSGTFFLTDIWRRAGDDGAWQVIARYSSYAEPATASARALHAATRESAVG
jgi:ketosteroid isomerase-like protein